MGTVVVPAAVLAFCLAPFGLDWIGLWIMGVGLRWILEVGAFVAQLDGARSFVHGPGNTVLPMIALGCLWIILWQGRLRYAGIFPVLLAFPLWAITPRPLGLVAENGTLVGVMTEAGRALSKPKGAGFIAQNWLENDGEATEQQEAAARWPTEGGGVLHGAVKLLHLSGKRAVAGFEGCTSDQIVIASVAMTSDGLPCEVYDPDRLRDLGALAIFANKSEVYVTSVRDVTGTRLWSTWRSDQ